MKMIKRYLEYIGFWKQQSKNPSTKEEFRKEKKISIAERKLAYLKEMEANNIERRNTIETKNSQLIGQASIVSSVFFLFISLLIDSFLEVNLLVRIILSIIFLVVLIHYLYAVIQATKTLEINRYQYPNRSTSTIVNNKKEIDFINEEIQDLMFIVNKSSELDNQKGNNLLFAARCFQIANIGFGILTIVIIIMTFFITTNSKKINEQTKVTKTVCVKSSNN
jgi:hypothetical protein